MDSLKETLEYYRLSEVDYANIKDVLGREPEGIEWACFSAMWSEHCCYKSSKKHLEQLHSTSKKIKVSQGMGEGSGIIDIGQGEQIAFKIESHNHPMRIDPYNGATTGVGGILRDIVSMNAEPIALGNFMCFGKEIDSVNACDKAIEGVADYGNCYGVPTVVRQNYFLSDYKDNPLLNAMAVGVVRTGTKFFTSKVKSKETNEINVVYVGSKTGKDGINGASMASTSFTDKSEDKTTIQIADPFMGKCVKDALLKAFNLGYIEACQDMGAAGLTCSIFEMASKNKCGMYIYLDDIPIRDSSITHEEILLSETQERMLLLVNECYMNELFNVFKEYNVPVEKIGYIVSGTTVSFYKDYSTFITGLSPQMLIDNAPKYDLPYDDIKNIEGDSHAINIDPFSSIVEKEIGLNGKQHYIHEQYDQMVLGRTVRDCRDQIGIVELPDSKRLLGIALGCHPHLMKLDTLLGAYATIMSPLLELATKGFEPMCVTNCLNFGNPNNRKVMTDFVHTLSVFNNVCESFDLPIISGNVSLFNETNENNIKPTPVISMIGLKDEGHTVPVSYFNNDGDIIYLLKILQYAELQGSEMSLNMRGLGNIKNISDIKQLYDVILFLAKHNFINSSKVIGKYGLVHNLGQMAKEGIGCTINTHTNLTNEDYYNIVVTVNKDVDIFKVLDGVLGEDSLVDIIHLGTVTKGVRKINNVQL